MTQEEIVLYHLEEIGALTSYNACLLYGITRLSAVIWNLRHDGYNIIGDWMITRNRYGKSVKYKVYRMEGNDVNDVQQAGVQQELQQGEH